MPKLRESTLSRVRRIRNLYLRDSDWTQMPDNGMSEDLKLEWAEYRQKLRDITDNIPDDGVIVWPVQPH